MRKLILKKLFAEMWGKDKYGSEEVTIKIKIDDDFDLDGTEPYFWETTGDGFIIASASENDLLK